MQGGHGGSRKAAGMGLSVEELAHFHREGFVVAKSVLPAAVIAAVAVANGECRSAAFQPPPSPAPAPTS